MKPEEDPTLQDRTPRTLLPIKSVSYLFLNNRTDALLSKFTLLQNSTCFGQFLCPSSGVLYCTLGTGKFHAGFLTTASKQSQDGTLYIRHWEVSCRFLMAASKQSQDGTQFQPDSAWKRSSKTCMKLTSAECTV